MKLRVLSAMVVLAGLLAASPCMAQASDESRIDYDAALGWLANSRIDGNALSGARGSIAVNQAAGDLNVQANLRSIAVGQYAAADVDAIQFQTNNQANAPTHASAVIGGRALQGAGGIASINQASGSGNAAFNAVALALAQQGIRETDDDQALSAAFASAGQQHDFERGSATAGRRVASVDSTALQGFEGVLQLNQVAGAGNDTGNVLSMSIQSGP